MKISIFGLGYVGCVSMGCLAENGHTVIGVDTSKTKVDLINSGKPTIIEKDIDKIIKEQFEKKRISATLDANFAIINSEISIIAVGTPSTDFGHLNLDYIFRVAESFAEALKMKKEFHVIAIRSTVTPGTCEKFCDIIESKSDRLRNIDFAVVDNPEFLREGTAVNDYFNPPLTLIGADNHEAAEKIASLYKKINSEIIITDTRIAEIMKYVNNTFHALKISFANEIGNLCKAMNIDSLKVMEIFMKDEKLNISPYYLKPGFAYGGSCLPKDLKALQTLAHDLYIKIPVIENINKSNEVQIERAVQYLENFKNKQLGFFGLSFKAGTDDLRNSPSVSLIETLIGKGFKILIFDKNIQLSKLTGTNKEYIDSHIPHLSKLITGYPKTLIKNCDVIIFATNENEYLKYVKDISNKIIVDLIGLRSDIRNNPNYYGINW